MMKLNIGLWVLLLVMGMVFSGCGDDPEAVTEQIIPPPPQDPVQAYQSILELRSYEDLEKVFHKDFRMMVLPATIQEWAGSDHPIDEPYFSHDQWINIHQNIFEAAEGREPDGKPLLPIVSIGVDVLDKVGVWQPVDEDMGYFSDFPEAVWNRYSASFQFHTAFNFRFEVQGLLDFVAIPVPTGGFSGFQLLGIILPNENSPKIPHDLTYDMFLSYYRTFAQITP
jgi:hypothetical protein